MLLPVLLMGPAPQLRLVGAHAMAFCLATYCLSSGSMECDFAYSSAKLVAMPQSYVSPWPYDEPLMASRELRAPPQHCIWICLLGSVRQTYTYPVL